MGMQNGSKLEIWWQRILIHTLELLRYCIFPPCTYISTGRKPALSSEVHLTARCA
jgi:hypothetical protein